MGNLNQRKCSTVALTAALIFGSFAFGQEQLNSSLGIVPEDTSFYLASMNHAACWKAVFESRAYQQLQESPLGEKMRKAYRLGRSKGFDQFGAGNPVANYLQTYSEIFANPGTKFSMPFLREIFSNEVFIYGDSKLPQFIETLGQIQRDIIKLNGIGETPTPDAILRSIEANLPALEVPTLVLGTVLSDPANMTDLMRLARSGIEQGLENAPAPARQWLKNFRVLEDDHLLFLTMVLDVNSIPWDEIAQDPGIGPMVAGLREILRDTKWSIGVGVKDHFLIATIGPSLDHVAAWGTGRRLIDAPRLAPLKTAFAAGHTLTSASFFSADYLRRMTDFRGAAEIVPILVEAALQENINETAKQDLVLALRGDAQRFFSELSDFLPRRGDMFGYSLLTNQGIEGFQYDFTVNRFQDSSKPLSLFQHAGERPALIVTSRGQSALEQFQFLRKWSGIGFDYVEKYIPLLAEPSAELDQSIEQIVTLRSLLNRFGSTTEAKMIPATAGGESGFVVDFVESQYQWHPAQPASTRDLPLPSLSIVLQISDPELLMAAGREYFELACDFVDWLRTLPGAEIPDAFQLKMPETSPSADGELFSYSLPENVQLHSSIVPHARLAQGLLVFSYFPQRSAAIVDPNSPRWVVPFAFDRNAARGVYINAHEFFMAADQWLRFAVERQQSLGLEFEFKNVAENDLLDLDSSELMETWDRVADFVQCFHGFSALTFTESDATISHYLLHFRDVIE